MPVLQYRCPKCQKGFEELVKSYKDEVICPLCGEKAERCYSGEMYSATGRPVRKCTGDCRTCGGC